MCARLEACHAGLKLQDNLIGLFHRLWMCFSLMSVQCPGGGNLPKTLSVTVISSVGPRNTRAQRSRATPSVAAVKTRAPGICKTSPLRETAVPEHGIEPAHQGFWRSLQSALTCVFN